MRDSRRLETEADFLCCQPCKQFKVCSSGLATGEEERFEQSGRIEIGRI